MTRIAVCLSGRGTNYAAIEEAIRRGNLEAEVALVASDRAGAAGLARARELGRRTLILPYGANPANAPGGGEKAPTNAPVPETSEGRKPGELTAPARLPAKSPSGIGGSGSAGTFLPPEDPLARAVEAEHVRWIVLAGFMRLLSPAFVRRFAGRIVNIHPALLPSFAGTRGIRDAYEAGVRVTGVTVHLVDEGMDSGPILAQEALAVGADETLEALEGRIHAMEHNLYPRTLAALFRGDLAPLRRDGRERMIGS